MTLIILSRFHEFSRGGGKNNENPRGGRGRAFARSALIVSGLIVPASVPVIFERVRCRSGILPFQETEDPVPDRVKKNFVRAIPL